MYVCATLHIFLRNCPRFEVLNVLSLKEALNISYKADVLVIHFLVCSVTANCACECVCVCVGTCVLLVTREEYLLTSFRMSYSLEIGLLTKPEAYCFSYAR